MNKIAKLKIEFPHPVGLLGDVVKSRCVRPKHIRPQIFPADPPLSQNLNIPAVLDWYPPPRELPLANSPFRYAKVIGQCLH